MDLTTPLRLVFGGSGETVVRECRRCGTTVGGETETCPTCESTAIVTYHM